MRDLEAPVENVLWSELTNYHDDLSPVKVRRLLEERINWPYFISKVLRENQQHVNCRKAEKLGILRELPDDVQSILKGTYILRSSQPTPLGPERQLLKLLSRVEVDQRSHEQAQELLKKDLDWGYLFRIACVHSVVSFIYRNLRKVEGGEHVPPPIMHKMQRAYEGIAGSNQWSMEVLVGLLKLFREHGVSAIEIKGLVLAFDIYKTLDLRFIGDLDILIRRQDLELVKRLMLDRGYVPFAGLLQKDLYCVRSNGATFQAWSEEHHHNIQFLDRETSSFVEVHWHLVEPSYQAYFDVESIWTNAKPLNYGETTLLTLSPEDNLFYLTLHAGLSNGLAIKLSDLCDIAQTITRYAEQLDWDKVMPRARTPLFRPFLYCVWAMVNNLVNGRIPHGVLSALKPGDFDEDLLRLLEERMFKERHGVVVVPLNVPALFTDEPVRRKLAIVARAVFPAREALSSIYGIRDKKLLLFYYLYRPFDLFIRYIRWFTQLLYHRASSSVIETKRTDAVIGKFVEAWTRTKAE